MSNFFEQFKGDAKKGDKKEKKKENPLKNMKNPFAQVGKAIGGQRKFGGEGQSLGGSRPGRLIHMSIDQQGPLGVKIEKRPNSQGTAIVAMVVTGSQAEAAGIQRGDILCHAGTNGEEEIMYNEFLALASSDERPLVFDVRRIESNANKDSEQTSAESYARKQAVIAAAEAREKAHKVKTKPISKAKESNLLRKPAAPLPTQQGSHEPMSEESKKAAEAAKADEHLHAAQLGYNPYEMARATAGQARNATVAMTHGTIQHKDDEEETPALNKAAPPRALPVAFSPAFEDAYTALVTTNEEATVKSTIGIMHKLIVNATTKGQDTTEDAAKFRKVRLSNAKIKAAITEVHGALDVMLSVGFQLIEQDGESFLVYPPAEPGPDWLPDALDQMKRFETS